MTTAVNEPATDGAEGVDGADGADGAVRPAASLPRLLPLAYGAPEDLGAHLARYGRPPYRGGPGLLIHAIETAGLTGRGGAAFPVHRKLAIVAGARGRKVIVANGAESEPASCKDAVLLRVAPNLVLDGLQLAAEAIGASEAYLYLHPGHHPEPLRAFAERSAAGLDRINVTLIEAPPRFLAGQESALVNRLGGGPAVPTFVPPRVSERGLGGAPTLVQNVETLAHLAQIARYGPRWFRALGTGAEPGSMLTTIHTNGGAAPNRRSDCQVIEAEIGTPLRVLLDSQPGAQAVLIGGFHGTWVPMTAVAELTLDNEALKKHGAALGAGVIAALPADRCGLVEAARVTRYLAAESAGQCGPCLNGLPRIAAALAELAGRGHRRQVRADVERWAGLVTGRGACNHPDGTVRFVRSALTVFAPEIDRHARGHCSAANRSPFLPLPDGMPMTEDDWT
jgi:NADH:ubiquinone oxidoreductase subunit F (NADH-binding)